MQVRGHASDFSPHRRRFLAQALCGGAVASGCSWLPAFAQQISNQQQASRQCIVLWMSGGASQVDTFDMKPEHKNGGEFKPIETNVAGIQISEHLPQLAKMANKLAIVRSLSTKEGDHGRGTYLMRTGKRPGGPVAYPTIGSSLNKELAHEDRDLPNYVSIAPYQLFNPAAYSSGFLGPNYAAATVGALNSYAPADNSEESTEYAELGLDHLKPPTPVASARRQRRLKMLRAMQDQFLSDRRQSAPIAHDTVYRRAIRMLDGQASQAFDLTKESGKVRDSYGKSRFGQGCLMARRLIERGVSVVEVNLGFEQNGAGWDTHANNFPAVRSLSQQLDQGWATLMSELDERGLLETTTILWVSEFGRTPTINGNAGRDHFPTAWSCVLAGGGISGGQFYGKTSADGSEVVAGKTSVGDVLATLCSASGVDHQKENISPIGRPFAIAEGSPIEDILSS